jgi:hypothetical protein
MELTPLKTNEQEDEQKDGAQGGEGGQGEGQQQQKEEQEEERKEEEQQQQEEQQEEEQKGEPREEHKEEIQNFFARLVSFCSASCLDQQRDEDGSTALIIALSNSRICNAQCLLEEACNVNLTKHDGSSALLYALLQSSSFACLCLLLDRMFHDVDTARLEAAQVLLNIAQPRRKVSLRQAWYMLLCPRHHSAFVKKMHVTHEDRLHVIKSSRFPYTRYLLRKGADVHTAVEKMASRRYSSR